MATDRRLSRAASDTPAMLSTGGSAGTLLRPPWQEFVLLLLAFATSMVASFSDGTVTIVANYLAPTILVLALAIGCVVMIRRGIAVIWTPLFWIRVSLIAYCGVGTLVPYLANEDTAALIQGFYQFFPADVAKYNLVVAGFVIILHITTLLIIILMEATSNRRGGTMRAGIAKSGLEMKTIGFMFLGVGLSVNYFIVVPASIGINIGSASSVSALLASMALVGYFIVCLWALQNRSKWYYVILFFVVADLFIGLILFNKTYALISMIIVAMAIMYHRPTVARFLILGGIILTTYFMISPVIGFGRNALSASYGEVTGTGLAERAAVLGSYRIGSESNSGDSNVQEGWARLSYVNGGTFAINQFDNGQPGDSLRYIFIVWIPRIIYPDKPIVTDVGRDFNFAVNGSRDSQSSPGLPAEAYWTLGWWGVALVATISGLALTIWSIYSISVIAAGAWHLLVVVLLGMRVGTRIDGFFVTDIVGPVGFAVVAHFALVFLNSLTLSGKQRGLPQLREA